MANVKTCSKCETTKPLSEFYRRKRQRDDQVSGYQHWCKPCNQAYASEYRSKNPEKHKLCLRNSSLKRRYGITTDDYYRILGLQDDGCAICGKSQLSKGFYYMHIDHDHKTGVVRGVLCAKCNTGIGQFDEDSDLLMKAAQYLRGA